MDGWLLGWGPQRWNLRKITSHPPQPPSIFNISNCEIFSNDRIIVVHKAHLLFPNPLMIPDNCRQQFGSTPSKMLNSSSGRFYFLFSISIFYHRNWHRSGAEPNSVLLFSETPLHIAASMVGSILLTQTNRIVCPEGSTPNLLYSKVVKELLYDICQCLSQ